MNPPRQHAAHAWLLQRFAASAGAATHERWRYLEAAHVLAQNRFLLHWRAHWQMLRFALQLRDGFEIRGQLGHLLMTPITHLVRFVPQGNTGRAIVPALQPMAPNSAVRECIAQALAAVGGAQAADGAPDNTQGSA